MGTSRTPAEFKAKVSQLPSVVIETERQAVLANAKLAKANALKELRKHVPSQRLKNVGKNGSRLNVRYTVDKATGRSADIKAIGNWQLVENDTKNVPYGVGSKFGPGDRNTRSKLILEGKYRPGGEAEVFKDKGRGKKKTQVSLGMRGGRKASVRTPWGWRSSVKVTKRRQGRRPWQRAFEKTKRELPDAYQRAADKALKRALRG